MSDDSALTRHAAIAYVASRAEAHRGAAMVRRPVLFCLTGSSGTGKTTIGQQLRGRLPGTVVLERDVLWDSHMDTPQDGYRRFNTCWLRLVADVQASGFSVLMCGTTMPYHFEALEERHALGDIHYLALLCDDDDLVGRLRARGPERDTSEATIDRMLEFNRWIRQNAASHGMAVLDTSETDVSDATARVCEWIDAVGRERGGGAP